mmetsp:Transcript_4689/g.11804  ORF Transcript_4689/g.11804 Transcript_4689/m.11804 type:complete len:244 (+) Transcript_4689:2547-3278(+)
MPSGAAVSSTCFFFRRLNDHVRSRGVTTGLEAIRSAPSTSIGLAIHAWSSSIEALLPRTPGCDVRLDSARIECSSRPASPSRGVDGTEGWPAFSAWRCLRRVFQESEREILLSFESFFRPNEDVGLTGNPSSSSRGEPGGMSPDSLRGVVPPLAARLPRPNELVSLNPPLKRGVSAWLGVSFCERRCLLHPGPARSSVGESFEICESASDGAKLSIGIGGGGGCEEGQEAAGVDSSIGGGGGG